MCKNLRYPLISHNSAAVAAAAPAADILLSLFDIVVCNNYPDHSAEGFKSFISVESCNQPSYLSSTGQPVFGDGCTFHYVCEVGYQPLNVGGSAGAQNMPMIKCSNGFWSARAICVKKEIANDIPNTNKNLQPEQFHNQNTPGELNHMNLIKRQPIFSNKPNPVNSKVLNRFRRSDESGPLLNYDNAGYEENTETFIEKDDDTNSDYDVVKVEPDSSEPKEVDLNLHEDQNAIETGWNENDKDLNIEDLTGQTSNAARTTVTLTTSTRTTTTTTTSTSDPNLLTGMVTVFDTTPATINRATRKALLKHLSNMSVEAENSANIRKEDSMFNWSTIMNNDSDKTIYESFNELLDGPNLNV